VYGKSGTNFLTPLVNIKGSFLHGLDECLFSPAEGTPWKILKGAMSDSVANNNYVGNTKISVSIKKTNANKCTLSEIFLTEIL